MADDDQGYVTDPDVLERFQASQQPQAPQQQDQDYVTDPDVLERFKQSQAPPPSAPSADQGYVTDPNVLMRFQAAQRQAAQQPEPPPAQAQPQPSVLADVAKSAAIGVPEGVIGAAGMLGDVRSAISSGTDYAARHLGISPDAVAAVKHAIQATPPGALISLAPTSEQIQRGVESVTGPLYQPQTTAGEYARTIGSFLPFAAVGPESLASRVMTQAVIPGVASELAGQVTKGTPYEPYARFGAGLVAGVGATVAAHGTPGPHSAAGVSEAAAKPIEEQTTPVSQQAGSKAAAEGPTDLSKTATPAEQPAPIPATVGEPDPAKQAALQAAMPRAEPVAPEARAAPPEAAPTAAPSAAPEVTPQPVATPGQLAAQAVRRGGGSEQVAQQLEQQRAPPEMPEPSAQPSYWQQLAAEETGGGRLPRGQPPPTPEAAAVLERVAKPQTVWDRIRNAIPSWREGYQAAKDDLDPWNQATKYLAEGKTLDAADDPHILARLNRSAPAIADLFVNDGTRDYYTRKKNGPSLKEVLKPVANDEQNFWAYGLAKRAIEKEAQGVETGIPTQEARAVVAQGAQRFEPVWRGVVGFEDRVLDYLQKSGVKSAEDVAKMRAKNGEYLPFYRQMDPDSEFGQQLGLGRNLRVKDPIYGMKGSQREILDPRDSIIRNTHTFIALAEHNRAKLALKAQALQHPEGAQFMQRQTDARPVTVSPAEINNFMKQHNIPASTQDAMTIFRPTRGRLGPDEMSLFENGKEEIYKVPKGVAEAANGLDRDGMNMLTRILAKPASLLRVGATTTPEFSFRNFFRDQIQAFAFSKNGYIPVYDAVRSIGNIFSRDDVFQDWVAHGGANSALVGLDRNRIKLNPQDFAGQVKNVITKPIDLLRAFSETMENATRLGEYKRAIAAGKSPTQAAFESREVTLDFARMGAKTRALNAIIPFFNAQLEGVDRAARAFRDNPVGTSTKVGMAITMPSVLLWFANKDDPRYQEIPQWQKDLFWIILTDKWTDISPQDAARTGNAYKRQLPGGQWQRNDGTVYRIPKPFELGVLFGSVPERVLDAFYSKNPNAFKNLDKSVIQALTPGFLPQAVTPALEQWANRSFFLDRSLIPERLKNLPPNLQTEPYTSSTAKAIGSVIGSVFPKSSFASPIIIDNYIRQYTGGLGGDVLDLMDRSLEAAGARPQRPTDTAADTPVLKAFAARFPSAGAQSVQDFYDTYLERKMNDDAIKFMRKHGRGDEAAQLQKQSDPMANQGTYKAIGKMYEEVRKTWNDPKLTPDAKRQHIDTIYFDMINRAQTANRNFERTKRKPASQPVQPQGYRRGGYVAPQNRGTNVNPNPGG